MKTLTLRGSDALIQQFMAMAKQLAKEGVKIEVLENESFLQLEAWDDVLQNKQLMRDLHESIQQVKNGELLSEEEAFNQLYQELGL